MNRSVVLSLVADLSAAALAAPQHPTEPSPVTVKLDVRANFNLLGTSDKREVERYEKDLKDGGLTVEEVRVLVDDDIQLRIALKTSGQAPAPSATAPAPQHPGMGPYVRGLVAQGVRGRELAAAIHAEKARRKAANGHGKGPKGADGAAPGKNPDVVIDPKGPQPGGKNSAGKPSRPDGAKGHPGRGESEDGDGGPEPGQGKPGKEGGGRGGNGKGKGGG